MSGMFTTMVESARDLLKIYQAKGPEAFRQIMEAQAAIVADDTGGNSREMNSRLVAQLYGILSVLFVHDDERIMRRQISLMENFINEGDPREKARLYVDDLLGFLDEYHAEQKGKGFSEGIRVFLASCATKELRQLTVQSLAERYGYNANYFSSRFRQEENQTLQEAIQNEKMNRAFLTLRDVEARITVKEVSHRLGFTDPAYFSQLFKTRFGCLPTQIRQAG